MSALFRYKDAWWPQILAIVYLLIAYVTGLVMLLSQVIVVNVLGVLLFAHAMVIAAYLVHECAHNSIFKNNTYHRWLAEVLLWICGSSYSHYEDIRHKHMRHHTDRADLVSFDYRPQVANHPFLLKLISLLEWFYIPAMEIIMHALVIILPFIKKNRHHRCSRVLIVLILRILFFYQLASISVLILLFYPISYMVFLTVMRFMDVHQHTYELFETLDRKRGEEAKKYDGAFEQKNTYSNLLSIRYPWLNLLVLNFPYHNAHHEQPVRPWYRLPSLHKQLYGDDQQQVLDFWSLIKSYHRYRVQRIINEDTINLPVKNNQKNFIGVDGVSFLTAH